MKKFPFLLMALLCLSFLFTGCPGGVPDDIDDSGSDSGAGTNPEAVGKYNFKASKIGMTSVTFTWDYIPDLDIGSVECKTTEKKEFFSSGDSCSATFTSLKPGTTYTFEFYAGCDDYHNSETVKDYKVTTVKKGPVDGFKLYYYSYDETISVFWDEIDENAEVSAVKLYKKTGVEGTYTLLKEYKDEDIYVDVEYEDEDVEKGNDYYYKAVTIDNDGNEIEAVEDHYEIAVGSPEKPANLTVGKQSYSSATITWDKNPIATSYVVYKDKNNSTYFPEWEKVEEVTANSYTVEIFDKKVHYAVEAKNEAGSSSKQEIEVQPKSLPSLVGVPYTATQNSVTFTFPEISSEDAGDVKYFYAVNDENIYEDYLTKSYKAKSEENNNIVTYSGLEFAKKYDYQNLFLVMYKEDADGNKITRAVSETSYKFSTKAFDAPTNVQVSDIKRTSATVSFEPIKEFYGVASNNVFYRITIDEKGGNGIYSMILNTVAGSGVYEVSTTDEKKLNTNLKTILSPDTEYVVTVEARTEDFEYDFHGDMGESEFTTVESLKAPSITSVSEKGRNGLETEVTIKYSDSNTGAVSHDVYYKIQNGSDWKKWNNDSEYLEVNSNTLTVKHLNAGNRYTFRIDSYPDDEPAAKVYSETEQLQCEKIPDSEINMPAAITNNGSLLNLSGEGVFVNDKGAPVSVRTSDTKYSWGVINFADEDGQFAIPPIGNYSYYTFKLDMTENLDGKNEEKLLLLVTGIYGTTWNGNKLGSCDLYIVKPNLDADILATPVPFKDIDVPIIEKDGTTNTKPSKAGYVIPEEYMYNNSVYIGVKDKSKSSFSWQAEDKFFIGFSYYY